MTTWIIIASGLLALWLLLAFASPMPKIGRLPLAAAMVFGLTGYMWQGMPDYPSAPKVRKINMDGFGEVIDKPMNGITNRYGAAARWIALADALQRQGNVSDAARILYGGTINYPQSADMWVAYGSALASASGGKVSPAAELAFKKAATLDEAHPGPQLFLGLAAAQKNEWDEASATWSALLARSPSNAPYRADLESRIKMIEAVKAEELKPADIAKKKIDISSP